jgi:hypothetical protein
MPTCDQHRTLFMEEAMPGRETQMTDDGTREMLELSDADFLRGLKSSTEHLGIIRFINLRIEIIAKYLEGITCPKEQ